MKFSSMSKIPLRWKRLTKILNRINADQVKRNAIKLEYTNYGKNINVSTVKNTFEMEMANTIFKQN